MCTYSERDCLISGYNNLRRVDSRLNQLIKKLLSLEQATIFN